NHSPAGRHIDDRKAGLTEAQPAASVMLRPKLRVSHGAQVRTDETLPAWPRNEQYSSAASGNCCPSTQARRAGPERPTPPLAEALRQAPCIVSSDLASVANGAIMLKQRDRQIRQSRRASS